MSFTTIQAAIIQASSLEHVRVAIRATESGVPVDPTGNVVTMAFKADGSAPVAGDFKTASWEVDVADPNHPVYYARCLVGPGGAVTLAAGSYKVFTKIVDSPETPVVKAPGRLVVED